METAISDGAESLKSSSASWGGGGAVMGGQTRLEVGVVL